MCGEDVWAKVERLWQELHLANGAMLATNMQLVSQSLRERNSVTVKQLICVLGIWLIFYDCADTFEQFKQQLLEVFPEFLAF